MGMQITLTVNGESVTRETEPNQLLVHFIRDTLRLTGTHVGCEHGVCGACTVLVDGQPTRSCLSFAVQMPGHDITTIEAVAAGERAVAVGRDGRLSGPSLAAALIRGFSSIPLSLGHAPVSSLLHIVPAEFAPAYLQAFEWVHLTLEYGTFFYFWAVHPCP